MLSSFREQVRAAGTFGIVFAKWLMLAVAIGLLGGMVGSAFHLSVDYVTRQRMANPQLMWLMPLCGLLIVWLYRVSKTEGKGTNAIISSVHFGKAVPILLVPVIFISTALTHLCGGSAGREGAALQIGGGLGCNMGRIFHLAEKDEPLAVLCGMSAVFSALFGTPIAATIFALEVCSVGLLHYSGLVPCFTAALTAFGITRLLGIAPTQFTVAAPALEPLTFLSVAVLALICALVSILFCQALHFSEDKAQILLPNPYLRVLAGSGLLLLLSYAVGCYDYNGAGMDIIQRAVEQGIAKPEAFAMKILFTAISLACGFKGGEVVPTLFIGSTLGCVCAGFLGIDPGFAAALGMTALFCGATNCPIASLLLALEIFGAQGISYFAAACFISYMLSGYTSLYKAQRIMYSKLRAEYINILAR